MAEGGGRVVDLHYDREVSRKRILTLAIAVAMDDDLEDYYVYNGMKRKRTHAFWMSPYLMARTDPTQRNTFAKLEADFLRLACPGEFRKTTRMPPSVYKELLDLVSPLIQRQNTPFRECLEPVERLSLTIRYLTRGDSVSTLHHGYLCGDSSVLPVVQDTCRAIYAVLHEKYLKTPSTEEEWKAVAQLYHDRWNLPHVIGSLDGKHIRITRPKKSGSLYWNYKNYYSIVLFAMVDADYRFLYVDVGAEGRSSDSTLWKFSRLYEDLTKEGNPLGLPKPEPFPGFTDELPYFFVGDDAFEMTENLMKPYPSTKLTWPQRLYNYRISRNRRCVENAFGILATRFRIFRREIEMEPENAAIVVMACCCLHNYLREKAGAAYLPKEATDWEGRDYSQHRGLWRAEPALAGGQPTQVRNKSFRAKRVRQALTDWILTKEGELTYQWDVVLNHEFFFER